MNITKGYVPVSKIEIRKIKLRGAKDGLMMNACQGTIEVAK